jgi:hypothetical protein
MTNDTRLIRILSVDDHPLVRSGIAALIDGRPGNRSLFPGIKLHCLAHAGSERGVALGEQCDLPALDRIGHTLHRGGDVLKQPLPLFRIE